MVSQTRFRKEVCEVGRELSVGDRRRPESKADLQPWPALLPANCYKVGTFLSIASFINNGTDNRICYYRGFVRVE